MYSSRNHFFPFASFELSGCLGGIFGMLNEKAIAEGTEGGLANMVKLSEEAQKAK